MISNSAAITSSNLRRFSKIALFPSLIERRRPVEEWTSLDARTGEMTGGAFDANGIGG